jgi:hypothetical protein
MRINMDVHQRVAWLGSANAPMSLAPQTECLAILQPCRDRYIERLAIGHHDPLFRAVYGLQKRD